MMNDYQRRILKEATKFGGSSISQNNKIAKLINEAPSLSTQIDSTIFGYSKQQFETKMRQLLSGMGFEKGISKMDISGKKMVLHFANAAKARDFTITFNGLTKRQSKGSPATINTSFDKIKAPAGTNAVVTVDFSMLKTEELEKEEYLFIMLESLCAEGKEEVEVSEAVNIGTNAYQIQRSGSNWEVWRLSYSQGSVRFPDGRKGTKLRDNFKSRDEAMAYAKKDAGVKEETDIEEGVRIMTGAETMIRNVGGSSFVSSFRKIKSALSAKPVGSVIVLFTEKNPEQYEIKVYDPKDFQDMVKGLTKKADAKVGSKGSWSDGEVTVIGIKEDVEQVDETWKSLKKTKANLDAIRKTGKRVVVWHGEGDTLYKVLPPKKAVKEEVEITDEGAGAPPSKSQLKKSIAWLQSLLKDPKKLAKSGLDVQDAKDNLAAALDMLDFANQRYKVKEDVEIIDEDEGKFRFEYMGSIPLGGAGAPPSKPRPRAEFDKTRANGLLARAMWMKRNNKSDSSIAAWWKQQDPELRKIASNARWWKTKYPELLKIIGEGVEQIEEMLKTGDRVKVPHKGKMVSGKIVRFDGGGTGKAQQHGGGYVVDVGDPASILVPTHKVVKEAYAHVDEKVIGSFYEKTGKQAFEYRISQDSWGKSHGYPHEVCVSRKDYKSRGDWRAANVKGTVCHIVTDEGEGGKPVVEKWTITKHVKYVKAEGEDSADRTTVEQNNELIAEAYITTEMVAEIRNQLKKKFPNFKFEVRRSPGGYGSIDIFIISGPVKFRDTDGDINHYHIQNYNNNSILKKMLDVINYKNWDRSDITTDYFDVGYYVHLYQGRDTWSGSKRTTKPYFIKNAGKKSVRESVENESKIDHIDEYSNAISEASNITPEQAMEIAKSIVSKAKELKVTVSSDGGSVVTCTKTITPGNQREFFAAYRDCDRVRGMVPYKGNTNEWGASTAGIGLGAQDAIKKGRVTVHKSGNGASAVLRALDKIT